MSSIRHRQGKVVALENTYAASWAILNPDPEMPELRHLSIPHENKVVKSISYDLK